MCVVILCPRLSNELSLSVISISFSWKIWSNFRSAKINCLIRNVYGARNDVLVRFSYLEVLFKCYCHHKLDIFLMGRLKKSSDKIQHECPVKYKSKTSFTGVIR